MQFFFRKYDTCLQLLSKDHWCGIYISLVENKYESFNHILKFYFDLAFPTKTIKHKKSKKTWISNDLKIENNQLILANKQANSKIGELTKT